MTRCGGFFLDGAGQSPGPDDPTVIIVKKFQTLLSELRSLQHGLARAESMEPGKAAALMAEIEKRLDSLEGQTRAALDALWKGSH